MKYREFYPHSELMEFVEPYMAVTKENYKQGIIDKEFYLEVKQEMEMLVLENKHKLAVQRALAANLI